MGNIGRLPTGTEGRHVKIEVVGQPERTKLGSTRGRAARDGRPDAIAYETSEDTSDAGATRLSEWPDELGCLGEDVWDGRDRRCIA